jgi:serine/threonine-protein kinase
VTRFFQEARIVNAIHHPNIVDVIDFIRSNNSVAYVMEYLEGPSLAAVLMERRLTIGQTLSIAVQLANALGAVHEVGVVHRDLKPANILVIGSLEGDLSAVPSVKIVDFGIAKASPGTAEIQTASGLLLGTPLYMAPEQVAGMPVSGKTDIYGFGEILYEMLSGHRPFEGDNMSVLRAKVSTTAPDISLPHSLPHRSELQSLIEACLAHEPEDRPTLRAIVETLDRIRGSLDTETADLPFGTKVLSIEPPSGTLPFAETSLRLQKKDHTKMLVFFLIAALIAGSILTWRQTEPVTIDPIPQPAPTPPIVVAPPPVEQAPVEKPRPKVGRAKRDTKPLKRELPEW